MAASKIEWTDETWNPIAGCTPVSPGCRNCYAARMARRLEAMGQEKYKGTAERRGSVDAFTGVINLDESALAIPLKRRKPTRFFVNSMSDLFHEDVPDGFIVRVLMVMLETPWHTYQILTKRPDRMANFFGRWNDLDGESWEPQLVRGPAKTRAAHPSGRGQLFAAYLESMASSTGGEPPDGAAWPTFDWMEGPRWWPTIMPSNIWLGTSVENQAAADKRIPHLLRTPAAIRFISAEPLLGPVDLWRWLPDGWSGGARCDAPYGDTPAVDWVIAGGESGPHARPMHPDWVRSIRDQCQAAGVAFHFKQWGEYLPLDHATLDQIADNRAHPEIFRDKPVYRVGKKVAGRVLDGREWNEFPAPIRIGAATGSA